MKRIVVVGTSLLLGWWWASARLYAAEGGRRAGGDDRTESPYFFVEGALAGEESFPLKSTKVTATVSGVIANVLVKQTYENTGASTLHARYVFPASTRAAIHGLTLRVGDKVVAARIKEREAANQEFEAAKREGKTATKLDQERPNVFTMSVANVLPKDRVEVELAYTELLLPSEGVYELVYPTVVGPRYAGGATAHPATHTGFVSTPYFHAGQPTPGTFDIAVTISAGMPLGEVRSPSHAITLSHEGNSVARVALARTDGDSANRDFILDYRLSGPTIGAGLLLYEGGRATDKGSRETSPAAGPATPTDNFFLLMVQPPVTVAPAEIPAREYVFVLDVSGSMHGFPLETAKRVLRDLIGHLRPTDSFNVVLFSGASHVLAPASLPATRANMDRAVDVIDRQSGGGGTELESALRTAMRLPRPRPVSRTIAVFTDGYIAEEPGAFALVQEHLNDTNLFAFGIGASVNRHLIEGLARAGQGEPFVVTDPAQAEATGARFRRTVETPVLTNIKVKAEGVDVFDVEPAVQADLFAERPIVMFGKWRAPRDASAREALLRDGRFTVTGRTAQGEFRTSVRLADHAARPENAALPRLWARARIARLSDFNFDDHQDEAQLEVTSLGLTYSLVTSHTSFVAVLQEVRNAGGLARPVVQPLPMPQGVSDMAVDGAAYGSGDEPELWVLALVLGALAALGIAARLQRDGAARA